MLDTIHTHSLGHIQESRYYQSTTVFEPEAICPYPNDIRASNDTYVLFKISRCIYIAGMSLLKMRE